MYIALHNNFLPNSSHYPLHKLYIIWISNQLHILTTSQFVFTFKQHAPKKLHSTPEATTSSKVPHPNVGGMAPKPVLLTQVPIMDKEGMMMMIGQRGGCFGRFFFLVLECYSALQLLMH